MDVPIISLVMVCNNHLVIMLGVLLKSIEDTHIGGENLDIYIVNDKISKQNVDRINQTVKSERIKLVWIDMKDAIPSSLQLPLDRTTFPVCAYARICAPYFLPRSVTKAIYLDVDMMLVDDINILWNIELGDKVIGAVLDRSEKVSSPWGGIKNYRQLKMDPETKYFNSGLLIMDLEMWRNGNATRSVIDAINENRDYVTFADQYGLNVVFANKWYELDPRWNCYAQSSHSRPALIHFTGMKPIFKGYKANQTYKEIFFKTLKLTPWANFKPKGDYHRFIKKFFNILVKRFLELRFFQLVSPK